MLRISTDNLAKTAFDFFLESIRSCGIPGRMRVDGGSEFNHVEYFMKLANGQNRGSFMRGKSVHNQRIERLWKDVHEKVVVKYKDTFLHMENVSTVNPIHTRLFWAVQRQRTIMKTTKWHITIFNISAFSVTLSRNLKNPKN